MTAYEVVFGDWSSDVCSSDLVFSLLYYLVHILHHNLVLDEFEKLVGHKLLHKNLSVAYGQAYHIDELFWPEIE